MGTARGIFSKDDLDRELGEVPREEVIRWAEHFLWPEGGRTPMASSGPLSLGPSLGFPSYWLYIDSSPGDSTSLP